MKMYFRKAATLAALCAALMMGGTMQMYAAEVAGVEQSTKKVTGVVVDQTGEAVIGASVLEKGTANGTITDFDGKFSLQVKPGATLVISYVGMVAQEVKVGNQSTINVELAEDSELLDDVVVVGYGTMKKSDLTGAVAQVKETDLKNRSTPDAAAALQGKAAGIQVITNSGAPGSASDIRVRGISSNSGNLGPLLIVDGLKVDNIQYLDPEMIESMEILKDAASAAIYGAEAGNGVVLITTKNGSKSKDGHVFYNNQFQLSSLARDLKVMNAAQYIQFGKENGWLSDLDLQSVGYNGQDTNWASEVFEPTWSNRHTVGFEGGNDRGNFFAAVNNIYNNGIFAGDKDVYKRLSLQVNADYKIKKWLTVGTNNSIEKWSTNKVTQQNDNGSALLAAITSSPLAPVVCDASMLTSQQKQAIADGKYVPVDPVTGLYWALPRLGSGTQSSNPFIQRDAADESNGGVSLRGSAYLNFEPIKDLVFTSRLGYRVAQNTSHSYKAPYYANDFVKQEKYEISSTANTSLYYQWENFVNYNKTIGVHGISAMAGMSYISNSWDNVTAGADGVDILKGYDPNFRYLDYVLDDAHKTIGNAPGESRSISYFGRLMYTYDNRYSIQANFRADAFDSSKLPAATRWGYFPSFSAGWTISNEHFIKDNISTDALSFLKLRASWGQNGNINVLSGYPYAAVINANSMWYQYTPFNPTQSYGSVPNGLPNPDLKWETSEQLDLGLDARFLNNRLTLGVDYFHKMTKDLLVTVTPVYETGVGSAVVNAGDVLNEGVEIELGWKDQVGDFSYSINGNLSTLHNEMTYLDPSLDRIAGMGLQGSKIKTYCEVGEPLWYMRGFKFKEFDSEGRAVFEDIDGNGVFDDNDMTNIGSGLPKVTYGITVNMAYKGFDFTMFGTGAAGNAILPQGFRIDRPNCNNYSYFLENSWTPETADNAKFPAVKQWDLNTLSSDLSIFDGSYFKIKTIQLGYTLPSALTKKIFVQNLRVFASLENAITFTKYIGLDPETAIANNTNGLGIDLGTYPTAKQAIFGVNISF